MKQISLLAATTPSSPPPAFAGLEPKVAAAAVPVLSDAVESATMMTPGVGTLDSVVCDVRSCGIAAAAPVMRGPRVSQSQIPNQKSLGWGPERCQGRL